MASHQKRLNVLRQSMTPSVFAARIRHTYVVVATIVLTTAVLFAGLNVFAVAYFAFREKFRPGNTAVAHARNYGISIEALSSLYPDLTARDIGDLLQETWTDNAMVYEPFTLFKERPRRGKYVNVHPGGFRFSSMQGPWPPDRSRYVTVFVFGGSTTFGYGVRDEETVVSHLQRLVGDQQDSKPVRFYNFGRGFYFLSQERILLQQLLSAGVVPDAAIFIDGLNDFAYTTEPAGPGRFREAVEGGRSVRSNLRSALQRLPAATLASRAVEKIGRFLAPRVTEVEPAPAAANSETLPLDDVLIQSVITRYVQDKKLIEAVAVAHGMSVLFVWQPVPMYNYDLRYHLFYGGSFGRAALAGPGYAAMSNSKREAMGSNFLWCADIQVGVGETLYVDPEHYSPAMNGRLAECISKELKIGDVE